MTDARRGAVALLIGVLGFGPARVVSAGCDVTGVDAAALHDTWSAMDAACDCGASADHRSYTRCAYAVVKLRSGAGLLPARCRSVARHRASQSTCGRPGTAVCCRITGSRVRGRIVRTPSLCKTIGNATACVADPSHVFDGCLPTGCVACGNGVVDPGEQCEPSISVSCTASCRLSVCGNGIVEPGEDCEAPTPDCNFCHLPGCGNSIVEPGEDCDPPGTGSCVAGCRFSRCGDGVVEAWEQCEPTGAPGCTDDCKAATCDAPPPGETAVACVSSGLGAVGVAAGPGGALVTWNGIRTYGAVNGRRLDSSGVPVEPVSFEVSAPVQPGSVASQLGPEVGGDASGWYVAWYTAGDFPFYAVGGARVDPSGAVASRQVLASATSFGMCTSGIEPPIGVVAEQPDQVAIVWGDFAGCFNGFSIDWHSGDRLAFAGGQLQSTTPVGFETVSFPQPTEASTRDGGVASGGGDTVATFMSSFADWSTGSPVVVASGLYAWWFPPSPGPVRLSSARTSAHGPGVAWGSASFLVAWPEAAPGSSDIRALRFTRAGGALDPDGGIVLATGTTVAAAPLVAFDGTSWLVVWLAQTAPGVQDVLGVAVREDGTVVDASPRVLAAGVAAPPSITPWSGGWLLGVVRAAGTNLVSVNVVPIGD